MPITRDIGAIRDVVRGILRQGFGSKRTIGALKKAGIRLNKATTIVARDKTLTDAEKGKFLRAAISKQPDAQSIGKLKRSEALALAGRIGKPSQRAKLIKMIEAALPKAGRSRRAGAPANRPAVRRGASGLAALAGATPEAARSTFGSTQRETSEAALQAIQKKFGIGHLAAVGGIGFGVRGLFTGASKADSQKRTQNLVTQLLSNQSGVNRQGLVNAQEEKTKLQSALLALKIIEQQKQTSAAQVIPFS